MGRKQTEKGAQTEEILRRYFLEQGFFVVRGLKLRQATVDVTDVDLWLYNRPSVLVRERLIVDARFRTRPQAMERIIWAVGVRKMLGVDRCIVATPDNRREVKEFASKANALIFDGSMLARLESHFSSPGDRLTGEDFAEKAFPQGDDKLLGDWARRADSAKSRLLDGLTFDGCNEWLEDAKYFLESARPGLARCDAALRLAYLTISFFLIGLDWVTRDTVFSERDFRTAHLEAGFRYGSKGIEGFENALRTSESLLTQFFPDLSGTAVAMRNRVKSQLQELPAKGLAEFFARPDVYSKTFSIASAFEKAAFAKDLPQPSKLELPLQAVVGAVLDFHGVSREGILGTGGGEPISKTVSNRELF